MCYIGCKGDMENRKADNSCQCEFGHQDLDISGVKKCIPICASGLYWNVD